MTSKPNPPGDPTGRRARREAARRDGRSSTRLRSAATVAPKPAWQSPMALMTIGAVLVGIVIVAFVALNSGAKKPTVGVNTPLELTDTTLADGMSIGKADAPVVLDVWSDYQCPGCRAWAVATEAKLSKTYVADGRLRINYRDYAFLDGSTATKESHDAATAARCAGAQGQYWKYHDYLYANQSGENLGAFSRDRLDAIAQAIGLDMTAFGTCYSDPATRTAVEEETASAAAVPVKGTPTLVLNGEKFEFQFVPTFEEMSAKLDALLGGSASPVPSSSPAPSPTP